MLHHAYRHAGCAPCGLDWAQAISANSRTAIGKWSHNSSTVHAGQPHSKKHKGGKTVDSNEKGKSFDGSAVERPKGGNKKGGKAGRGKENQDGTTPSRRPLSPRRQDDEAVNNGTPPDPANKNEKNRALYEARDMAQAQLDSLKMVTGARVDARCAELKKEISDLNQAITGTKTPADQLKVKEGALQHRKKIVLNLEAVVQTCCDDLTKAVDSHKASVQNLDECRAEILKLEGEVKQLYIEVNSYSPLSPYASSKTEVFGATIKFVRESGKISAEHLFQLTNILSSIAASELPTAADSCGTSKDDTGGAPKCGTQTFQGVTPQRSNLGSGTGGNVTGGVTKCGTQAFQGVTPQRGNLGSGMITPPTAIRHSMSPGASPAANVAQVVEDAKTAQEAQVAQDAILAEQLRYAAAATAAAVSTNSCDVDLTVEDEPFGSGGANPETTLPAPLTPNGYVADAVCNINFAAARSVSASAKISDEPSAFEARTLARMTNIKNVSVDKAKASRAAALEKARQLQKDQFAETRRAEITMNEGDANVLLQNQETMSQCTAPDAISQQQVFHVASGETEQT